MPPRRTAVSIALVAALALALAGCPGDTKQTGQQKQVDTRAGSRQGYLPSHDVEFNNYNRAQRLYDSPSTIIWCSTTWGNPAAPIVTVPITGKLTSSSVSLFPSQGHGSNSNGTWSYENRSVDGMYHGSPPPYRYGFTPGGQYVDFFNMQTVCTTALTKFQRQKTDIALTVDKAAQDATTKAEKVLRDGTDPKTNRPSAAANKQAQAILEGASLDGGS